MYQLIDEDTNTIVATTFTRTAALEKTGLYPSDVVPDAESWSDVLEAAEGYDGGLMDLLDGWRIAENPRLAWLVDHHNHLVEVTEHRTVPGGVACDVRKSPRTPRWATTLTAWTVARCNLDFHGPFPC